MGMGISLKVKRKVKRVLKPILPQLNRIRLAGRPKIFGIGANKTGTTSLKTAMQELGYIVGDQRTAENLIDDWAKRDFSKLITYCKTAEFFQDVPFSLGYTYIVLDQVFKDCKFILTVRNSPEDWYNSLVRFHSRLWGKGDGTPPGKKELQEAFYIYKGRPWHVNRLIGITPEDDLYNREMLIDAYVNRNHSIKEYFRHRPDDLLVLNVADENSYTDLCNFLGVKKKRESFPWENRT